MTSIRSLQRTVHVACRELGIDEDTRRDLQLEVSGKASMRDMNHGDLTLLVRRLERAGFKKKPGSQKRKKASRADVRYIHVLWRLLGEEGVLKQPSRDGLNAFIRARFEKTWGYVLIDVDALVEWQEINDVIEALTSWCDRVGIHIERSR